MFTLLASSPLGRRGIIRTAHGDIPTPCFMPVGTGGAMRGITLEDLESLGADILLCNTYHLHIRPGEAIVRDAGGLHAFTGWRKPIITDSGGFQVFSLTGLRELTDAGVHFQSHLDGTPLFLGPEESIRIQHALGADIILCFDECPPSTAPRDAQLAAVERTLRWAATCKKIHEDFVAPSSTPSTPAIPSTPSLFAIVQGGLERDLRERCAKELVAMDFDGYAIGGLAVGETEAEMMDILDVVCPLLPSQKPRYLMGVGRLEQMRQAVARGIDMFDCVLPMREARHGTLYLASGERVRITGNPYMRDHSPIDADSPVPSSRAHTKSYLNYLLRADERYGETLACLQNLGVTLEAMRKLREQITP